MSKRSLDEVFSATEETTAIVLVYVPGVENQFKAPRSVAWHRIVPKISPVPQRTTVLEYKHAIGPKHAFSDLLDCGSILFHELFDFHLEPKVAEGTLPNVYFICKLLGGLILKEAFARIHPIPSRRQLVDAIRGVFFLGVPHVESVDQRDRLSIPLRLKPGRISTSVLSDDVLLRIRISAKKFRAFATELGPNLFIVSAYGKHPSTSSLLGLVPKTSSVFISEYSVRIGLHSRQENTLQIDPDLECAWDVRDGASFQALLLGYVTDTYSIKHVASSPFLRSVQISINRIGQLNMDPTSSPAAQSSDGSFVHITPPGSQRSSHSASSSSSRATLSSGISATLPFRYPESHTDREKYFQGREEDLKCIASVLDPSDPSAVPSHSLRVFTISGIGGIGKTELAYRYVTEYQSRYSVLLFLTADHKDRLTRSYDRIAVKLGLLSKDDQPSHEECREALKAWFKDPREIQSSRVQNSRSFSENEQPMLRWLLVFNNVEDWATISPYWPEKGYGSVLLTSRRPNVLSELMYPGPMGDLRLSVLTSSQGGQLLKHYAGQDGDDSASTEQAAQDLANRLENLPLAIIQVGSYIKQCQLSILKFAQIHQRGSDLYNVYLEEDRVHDYEHNLASVWAIESLQEKSRSGHDANEVPSPSNAASRQAFALLCSVALLDPEGVSEELLKPGSQRYCVADYPSNEPEFYQRLRLLINSSLVERNTSESEIRVHRMVQYVVRAKVALDAQFCQQLFEQVLGRIAILWPYIDRIYAIGSQGHIDRWPRCESLLPHITTLSQAYLEFRERGCLETPSLDFAELLYEAATYHSEISQPEEATELLDLAQKICSFAEETTSHDTVEYQLRIYRGRIHVAFLTQNKVDYFKYAELSWRAEVKVHETTGTNSQRLAAANLHMGIAHNFHELYQDAILFLEESANIRRTLPGFKPDWLFSPLYQLAHAYHHLGDDLKAATLLETAISDRVEAFGENDRYSVRTGVLYYTLGDIKLHQGELNDSFVFHVKAHTHLKATVGPNNLSTMHCKYKVAIHHARLQDLDIVRTYLDECLLQYRLKPWARMYICRTAFLHAKYLRSADDEPLLLLDEAAQIFNEFSTSGETRTAASITEDDAMSIVAFDYL